MLPSRHRLRSRAEFDSVTRSSGRRRAGSHLLVVHANDIVARSGAVPRVGFVVSGAVGNAVVRNRTKRRLRALMAARLRGIPAGHDVVVRAERAAGEATSATLAAELDRLLPKVVTHR